MQTKFKLDQQVSIIKDLKDYLDSESPRPCLPIVMRIIAVRKEEGEVLYELSRHFGKCRDSKLIAAENVSDYIRLYTEAKCRLWEHHFMCQKDAICHISVVAQRHFESRYQQPARDAGDEDN